METTTMIIINSFFKLAKTIVHLKIKPYPFIPCICSVQYSDLIYMFFFYAQTVINIQLKFMRIEASDLILCNNCFRICLSI